MKKQFTIVKMLNVLLILTLIFVSISCKKDKDILYDGDWYGRMDSDTYINFNVSNNSITCLNIEYKDFYSRIRKTIKPQNCKIVNNSFSYNVRPYYITGSFYTNSSAEGNYKINTGANNYLFFNGTWTASKR